MKRLIHIIKRQTKNSEGFTLVEAMISMVVFVIGILGILTLQITGIKGNTLGEDVQNNTVTAMGQIEGLMAADFLDQRLWGGQKTYQVNGHTIRMIATDDTFLPGSMRVQLVSEFTPSGGLSIAHADGTPQSITLNIFKPDIDRITP